MKVSTVLYAAAVVVSTVAFCGVLVWASQEFAIAFSDAMLKVYETNPVK